MARKHPIALACLAVVLIAGATGVAYADSLVQPLDRAPCACAAPPPAIATGAAATGTDTVPITGELAGLRPSERLLGREQALRARFRQQMQAGTRPWLVP